mmetsp:Transcript_1555/g.2146  ORF Transcript_1555/g.2146 Transcript_1555/m.2146 type:complete len:220 (+) Transcript_1555:460-1119(+)
MQGWQVFLSDAFEPAAVLGAILEFLLGHSAHFAVNVVFPLLQVRAVGVGGCWGLVFSRLVEGARFEACLAVSLKFACEIHLVEWPVDRLRVSNLVAHRTDLLASNPVAVLEGVEPGVVADSGPTFFLLDKSLHGSIVGNCGALRTQLRQRWPLKLSLREGVSAFFDGAVHRVNYEGHFRGGLLAILRHHRAVLESGVSNRARYFADRRLLVVGLKRVMT